MALGEKLEALIKASGRNINEVAISAGVSPQTVYSIIKRNNTKADIDDLQKICNELGTTLDYFTSDDVLSRINQRRDISLTKKEWRIGKAYGAAPEPTQRIVDVTLEPYMDKASSASAKLSEANTETSEPLIFASPNRTRLSLPLPMQSLSAGPGEYINGDYMAMAMVTLDISARKADYLMRVTGDSMEPDYPDGCIVAVEATSDIRHGEVGVFSVDGDHYLKKKGREGLMSINPKYPAIIINENNDVRCHGRVVGIAVDVEYIEE